VLKLHYVIEIMETKLHGFGCFPVINVQTQRRDSTGRFSKNAFGSAKLIFFFNQTSSN